MSSPEQDRNRILRRADWRFLLPEPNIGTSICFTAGPLAEATAAVSRKALSSDAADVLEPCDLAVATNPTQQILRQAWAALRPGGTLYIEWGRVWSGGPAGARLRLQAAGFTGVACYAPRPAPWHKVEWWVPLESDGAVRYFLARTENKGPALRRVVRRLGKVLWQVNRNLRVGLPLSMVARKPHSADDQRSRSRQANSVLPIIARDIPPELESELLSVCSSGGSGATPDRLATLLVTRGKRSINKTVALLFAEGDRRPLLAVKRARVPESGPALLHEAEVLRVLHSRPGGVRGAPRVLFCRELDGIMTLAETVIEGTPVSQVLDRQNFRDLALRAADWSANLMQSPSAVPSAVWWPRLIDPVLAEFYRAYHSVLDEEAFRAAGSILSSLEALPLVCEQRDYSPWNLLVMGDGELGVLDWESAETHGLPVLDLVYFLTYLSAYADHSARSGDLRSAWRACLQPGTVAGDIASECLGRYLARVSVPMTAVKPLALLAWMIHGLSEYKQLCLDLGRQPDPAALRKGTFLRLWFQELSERSTR